MIAACYSNPNWDGKDNAEKRKEYLQDINRHFNEAITAIYYPEQAAQAVEVDWNNPFFAAHKREIDRTRELFQRLQDDQRTIGDVIKDEKQEEEPSQNGHSRYDDFDQIADDDIPRNN